MKQIICILAFIALLMPHAQGQTFACATQTINNEINPPAINITDYSMGHKEAKKLAIAGFIGMGAGATLFVIGVDAIVSSDGTNHSTNPTQVAQSQEQMNKVGVALLATGAVVFVAGSVMAICGGIAAHPRHRWSAIAPKGNEVGLAYNF